MDENSVGKTLDQRCQPQRLYATLEALELIGYVAMPPLLIKRAPPLRSGYSGGEVMWGTSQRFLLFLAR